MDDGSTAWQRALSAAALLAVDPAGLGGVLLRARAGPVRERWLAHLQALLPAGTPWRRVPLHTGDERLLGGLDLSATLRAGRPVAQAGLLAQADRGLLLLAMAERVNSSTAARLAAAMDRGEVHAEREGTGTRQPSRFGVVALDEGDVEEERPPALLAERLGLQLDLSAIAWREAEADEPETPDAAAVAAARERLSQITFDASIVQALCAATLALGVASPRAAWLAWRAACAAAALAGRTQVLAEDAALAAGLVLGPRATQAPPAPAEQPEPPEPPEPPPPGDRAAESQNPSPPDERPLDDRVVEAALAALPAGLLAALQSVRRGPQAQAGQAGAFSAASRGGRPLPARRGPLRGGARLSLIDTLRAAAPWQALRRREAKGPTKGPIAVRPEDFHLVRRQQRSASTTVFVIDASGSQALHRLAEAKGAVNLLLADCYVRRDSVAVLAFRGRGAELLLPPTRSLLRARRCLSGLPGGGGTPLAAGIEAALTLAMQVQRSGATPVLVFLTDGRANVARDGSGGRPQAEADAHKAARLLRASGLASLLIDTSPQPAASAQRLAAEMAAQYRALPHAGAQALSQAVRGLQAGHG